MEKSYNQVPPINRALVRKIILNAFGKAPEEVFRSFDADAFAAASLGQVHFAVARTGEMLAVKIQYPGISRTIKNDIQMVKGLLRPLAEYDLIRPALKEIEEWIKVHFEAIKGPNATPLLTIASPYHKAPIIYRLHLSTPGLL